jgi:hypothetical protein
VTHLETDMTQPPAAPIDMLEHYFGAHGWACERHGDEEIVASVEGSWAQYQLRALWREDERMLQFVALPDVRVPEAKRTAIYETIGLINEQLWMGHFEMWAADGTLLFRHATLLDGDDEIGLSLDQAETLVEAAIDECERYYPVFQFVLWAGKKPAEALDAALIDTVGEA